MAIHLGRAEVAAKRHEEFDPNTHDFFWNADYTEVDVVKLKWHDEASYAQYQSDTEDDL